MDYDSYYKMFGGGVRAAEFAMQDRDQEQAKGRASMEAQRASTQAQNLANMFNEQNNPLKLQENQLSLDYTTQTQPAKIKNDLAEFAKKAKQSDIDMMYLEAQKMMGEGLRTGNKDMYEMGNKIFMTHKDFMKIREQGEVKATAADQKLEGQKVLEGIKQGNRVTLKQTIPGKAAGGGGSGGGTKPLGMDKLHALYTQEALEADARGDKQAAAAAWMKAQSVADQYGSRRLDTYAGKTILTPNGEMGQAPPRPAPKLPSQKATPALPSGWTMK